MVVELVVQTVPLRGEKMAAEMAASKAAMKGLTKVVYWAD